MLKVEGLRKLYGELVAVDGISLTASSGSVFGLLGPNGAGKSTLISCVSGLLRPSAGRVLVAGHDIVTEPREARRAIGIVPQELALYEDLSAVDNLRYWGEAYGLQGRELGARVDEVLAYIGLGDRARDLPSTFSGGMKRRLNFGCGIVHRPQVLLLDEPTVGVDPQSRERLFEMTEEQKRAGSTVLYTTHYMEEAERLCDTLAIVDHGAVIASGTVAELRAQVGERDVLLLDGVFPDGAGSRVIETLSAGGVTEVALLQETSTSVTLTLAEASRHLAVVFEACAAVGAQVTETNLRRPSLETLFLKLTGKDLRA